MAPYFPDETGFQNILEYIGLRFEFIRRATVATPSTLADVKEICLWKWPYLDVKDDPGLPYQWWFEADNNLPEFYQELGWDVLLHLYNKFRHSISYTGTDSEGRYPTTHRDRATRGGPKACGHHKGFAASESNKVEGELRLAMERIVQLEEHWSPGDIFDAIKSSEVNGRSSWPFT
ncbi:hypothetical protein BU15DRAFT_82898 [Melanogaster broomeanus]|nr:hypothetical protein BU15DRAFT_82898 [Melanogaster broomeanus]